MCRVAPHVRHLEKDLLSQACQMGCWAGQRQGTESRLASSQFLLFGLKIEGFTYQASSGTLIPFRLVAAKRVHVCVRQREKKRETGCRDRERESLAPESFWITHLARVTTVWFGLISWTYSTAFHTFYLFNSCSSLLTLFY